MFSEFYATVPALDNFVTMEKSQRIRNFLEVMIKRDQEKNMLIPKKSYNKYNLILFI